MLKRVFDIEYLIHLLGEIFMKIGHFNLYGLDKEENAISEYDSDDDYLCEIISLGEQKLSLPLINNFFLLAQSLFLIY